MIDSADYENDDVQTLKFEEARIALRLLGAAMRDSAVARDLIAFGLAESDFTAPRLASLWRTAVPIFESYGQINHALVEENLSLFEGEHPAHEVVRICLDAKPLRAGSDTVAMLLDHMRKRVANRRLQSLASQLFRDVSDAKANPQSLIGRTRSELDRIATTAAVFKGADGREVADIVMSLATAEREPFKTISLGIPDIDRALRGGAVVGRPTTIVAAPGVGKSVYARHIVLSALRAKEPALIATTEADREEVCRELAEMIVGERLPTTLEGRLSREAMAKFAAAAAWLRDQRIFIEDGSFTVEDIFARASAIRRREPGLRLIVIDYVQDIMPSHGLQITRDGKTHHIHEHTSSVIREVSKSDGYAVVSMAQDGSDEKNGAARVAGSSKFFKDSAAMIWIDREEKKGSVPNVSKVSIKKNRTSGIKTDAWMSWEKASGRLTPCTREGQSVVEVETDSGWGDEDENT